MQPPVPDEPVVGGGGDGEPGCVEGRPGDAVVREPWCLERRWRRVHLVVVVGVESEERKDVSDEEGLRSCGLSIL